MKPLIVVLIIAGLVFSLAKPVALQFSAEADFLRRRNIWITLTVVAFLSPSFWLFAAFAIPLYFWGGRKDSNPLAFYLILFQVVPGLPVDAPILLTIDNYSLLAFFVLFPAWLRFRRIPDDHPRRAFDAMDWGVLLFGVLQTVVFVIPDLPGHSVSSDSTTNQLRRAFLFLSGNWLIFIAASRGARSRQMMTEMLASFCLSCSIFAAVAVLESMRSWNLYSEFGVRWTGDLSYGFYLVRGASLRAKAAANTPLELGYLLAIGLGAWIYISEGIKSKLIRWSTSALFCLGLLAAYSRGPWIGACVVVFSYLWIRSCSLKTFLKIISISAIGLVAISLTPIGKKIALVIPALGGQVDEGNINYRQRLFERCVNIIKESPFFGDPWVYFKMEDLRQGQGIIDFVNTYAEEAVFYGLVGLVLFISPILIGLIRTYRAARLPHAGDALAKLGFCLVAMILGSLVMLATTSFLGAYAVFFYMLAGLASAYAHRNGRSSQELLNASFRTTP